MASTPQAHPLPILLRTEGPNSLFPGRRKGKGPEPFVVSKGIWGCCSWLPTPKEWPTDRKKGFRSCRTSGTEGTTAQQVCKDPPISILPSPKCTIGVQGIYYEKGVGEGRVGSGRQPSLALSPPSYVILSKLSKSGPQFPHP